MTNREKAKEKSRAGIQKTALSLFGKYGYNGSSIRMIAKEANISLGLMYNYYDGKEGLIKSIFETNIQGFTKDFDTLSASNTLDFTDLINSIFNSIDSRHSFWRLVYSIRMQEPLNQVLSADLLKVQNAFITEIKKVLEKYKLTNLNTEAYLLYSVLDGIIHNYLADSNFPREKVLKLLIFKYSKLNVSAA
jgi:AcrR family transcriptional regulator